MILTPEQQLHLLAIISTNQAVFIGKQLGVEFLSEGDKITLSNAGINIDDLYNPFEDSIQTSFHLGMLAVALQDAKALDKLSYNQVKDYISKGEYIPLTERDKQTISALKNQTFADIKKNNGLIFQDINGVLNGQSQEDFLKQEIIEGVKNRRSIKKIASDIHHKTGDWKRNFSRIVEYQSNSALQQGRAAMYEKDGGVDVEVFKIVFASACSHCLRLYTTAGFRSQPIVFKLSELKANGTNIGRKTKDWKATIDSTHPFCRCFIKAKRRGFSWNEKTQDFDIVIENRSTVAPILKQPRNKIRISIAGEKFLV